MLFSALLLGAWAWWAVFAGLPVPNRDLTPAAISRNLGLESWVTLDSLPPELVRRTLEREDSRFYSHGAVDWKALAQAALKNLRAGRYKFGASTITQQVARNLFLSPEKTLRRKAKEMVLARRLEAALGKDPILEIYFNIAEFYPGRRGVEAAARIRFGVAAANLQPGQADTLSRMLPNPRRGL